MRRPEGGRRGQTPMDRPALAAAARRGDVARMRELHGIDAALVRLEPGLQAAWAEAGREWSERLNPPRRPVRPGGIDFVRLHALALDRLDDLLADMLPEGSDVVTADGWIAWRGRRPGHASPVDVDLLIGRWDQYDTGRGGHDLVSLRAFLDDGSTMGRAARSLAAWLKVGLHRAAG